MCDQSRVLPDQRAGWRCLAQRAGHGGPMKGPIRSRSPLRCAAEGRIQALPVRQSLLLAARGGVELTRGTREEIARGHGVGAAVTGYGERPPVGIGRGHR